MHLPYISLFTVFAMDRGAHFSIKDIQFTSDRERLIENGYTELREVHKIELSYRLPKAGTRTHVAAPIRKPAPIKQAPAKTELGKLVF